MTEHLPPRLHQCDLPLARPGVVAQCDLCGYWYIGVGAFCSYWEQITSLRAWQLRRRYQRQERRDKRRLARRGHTS